MNRRGFFGLVGAALAGVAVDPERLLWTPGKKLISVPAPSLSTWEIITETGPSLISECELAHEMLLALGNNLDYLKRLRGEVAWPSSRWGEKDRIKIVPYVDRQIAETERAIIGARTVRFMTEVKARGLYPEYGRVKVTELWPRERAPFVVMPPLADLPWK